MTANRRCHSAHLSGRKEGEYGPRPAPSWLPPHPALGAFPGSFQHPLSFHPVSSSATEPGVVAVSHKKKNTEHKTPISSGKNRRGDGWFVRLQKTHGSQQAQCCLKKTVPKQNLSKFQVYSSSPLGEGSYSCLRTKKINA